MQTLPHDQKRFELTTFQDEFAFSNKRYPCFLASVGTGKTMAAIFRAVYLSEKYPGNLGIIIRKEFTDLRDSTMKDWERYTGHEVPTNKDFVFPNGSVAMFRHGSEINVLKNINAGWVYIEQGEEFPSDETFQFLRDRLRRQEAGFRSMFMTANACGHNWIWKQWIGTTPEHYHKTPGHVCVNERTGEYIHLNGEYHCVEANTFANAKNLPSDFIEDKKQMRLEAPEHYKRYVLNDHEAQVEGRVFNKVDDCAIGELHGPENGIQYVLGVDLAKSVDYTVLIVMNLRTKNVDYYERMESENRTSWNYQKEKIKAVSLKYNNALTVLDSTGVGDPIVEDLQRMHVNVYHQQKQDSDKTTPGVKFTSISKENLIDKLKVAIELKMITFPNIDILANELKEYECTMTRAGNHVYNAPEGKHDDCVIALALALWGSYDTMYAPEHKEPEKETPVNRLWKRIKTDMRNKSENSGQGSDSEYTIDESDAVTITED